MQMKCEYCGSMIPGTADVCPHCGAANKNMQRAVSDQPQTIEQLKQWYIDRKLPPEETTRFFIGRNYTKPKAFGIYRADNGNFVVYKNKADGSRAIRYEGTDEAYAVNELYQKLKSEILNQKARNISSGHYAKSKAQRGKPAQSASGLGMAALYVIGFITIVALIEAFPVVKYLFLSLLIGGGALFAIVVIKWIIEGNGSKGKRPSQKSRRWNAKYDKYIWIAIYVILVAGIFVIVKKYNHVSYYRYEDDIYCKYHGQYYYYDDYYDDYWPLYDDVIIYNLDTYSDVYEWEDSSSWSDTYTDFLDSDYYDDHFSSSSDSGSDYDWDSGSSWDSGGSDWDSDW